MLNFINLLSEFWPQLKSVLSFQCEAEFTYEGGEVAAFIDFGFRAAAPVYDYDQIVSFLDKSAQCLAYDTSNNSANCNESPG